MKTSPTARRILQLRVAFIVLTIAAILGFEFFLGQSAIRRIGQTTGGQTNSPAVPNVSFSDLLAGAR